MSRRWPRNDVRQYDELAMDWWAPFGRLAMLRWIAAARAGLLPRARREDAVLLDLACGGGLLAPHVRRLGYRHVGVDLSVSALAVARGHGVEVVRGDVTALPFPDGVADAVSAGEVFEHVRDLPAAVSEACRVLRPGGVLVLDTIAATAAARFLAVTVAERVPGGAPAGIHDPALFVDRDWLRAECAGHGVPVALRGLWPSLPGMVRWLRRRDPAAVRMIPTRVTCVLFQGYGVKEVR